MDLNVKNFWVKLEIQRVPGLQFSVLSRSEIFNRQYQLQQQKVFQTLKYTIYGIALSPGNCA